MPFKDPAVAKEYGKKYYLKNTGTIKLRASKWQKNNQEKRSIVNRRWSKSNPDKKRESTQAWRKNNIEHSRRIGREYSKKKLIEDTNYLLSHHMRNRLRSAVKGGYKSGSAVRDLGCSIPEFVTWLEGKFQLGMSWDNYGINGWHVDHVVPLVTFDLTDRGQLLKAVHYTNLQPMWAFKNRSKGGRIASNIINN